MYHSSHVHKREIAGSAFVGFFKNLQSSHLARLFSSIAESGSSRPGVFCKKSVFRNFAKFTGKYLCKSLFFNKVAYFRPATLLKKRLWHRCFPVNFAKFLRTPFLTELLRWLLLRVATSPEYHS